MLRNHITCLLLFIAGVLTAQRSDVLLEENWKFSKGKIDGAEQIDYDDRKWETVSVPHDWAIYGPFDKDVDKQVVAITQNGEQVATEKTGRTGALPFVGEAWYRSSSQSSVHCNVE